MTPNEIEVLFKASQSPLLSPDQRSNLKLENPFTLKGRVAEVLQLEVGRIDPVQARVWRDAAGASMSLQAAAAAQGLAPVTPEIQQEIDRFNPMSEAERQRHLIAETTKNGNPFDKRESYDENGRLKPASENLTQALLLEINAPQEAARLKREAAPKEKGHNFTDREAALLSMHGYRVPTTED